MTVTRRRFLAVSSALVAEASLAPGCTSRRTVVRGACHHDGPDGCSWLTTVEGGRVVRFEGDPGHPFTRGRLCARMSAYPDDVVFSADRILHPLRRTGKKGEGRFERVSWDEALGEVADRLQRIVGEHGPAAVLPYSYAGTEGKIQGESIAGRFFARMGASRLQRDVCGSAAHAGLSTTIGTSTGILPGDLGPQPLHPGLGREPRGQQRARLGLRARGEEEGRTDRGRRSPEVAHGRAGRRAPAAATRHRRRAGPGPDERDRPRGASRRGLREPVHGGLRPARRAGPRVPAGEGGGRHRAHRGRDRRPGPRLRDDEAGGPPAHDRHGAPRQRGQHVPDPGLPARPRRRVAGARGRPRGVHGRSLRGGAEPRRLRCRPRAGPEDPLDQHGPDRQGADGHEARPAPACGSWSTTAIPPSSPPTRTSCGRGSGARISSPSWWSSSSPTPPATRTTSSRPPPSSSTWTCSPPGDRSTSRSTCPRCRPGARPGRTRSSSAG